MKSMISSMLIFAKISLPYKYRIRVVRVEVIMPTYIESFAIPKASESLFGRTIAVGYVNAAMVDNIPTKDIKTPCTPNASGPYRRVINGANSIVIACAAAVPLATAAIFRRNGRFFSSLSLFNTFLGFCFFACSSEAPVVGSESHEEEPSNFLCFNVRLNSR